MITFGELRKLSLEWHTDIGSVEAVYALDWLLKSLFESPRLGPSMALRGPAALSKAFFEDYPQVQDADLASRGELREADLALAAVSASRESGIVVRLASFRQTQVRFEYTGPLGRRSAAQPHVTLRFHPFPKLPPRERPLLHPFRERLGGLVWAVALEEMAAEYLVAWTGKPRARDVYDLWFILAHAKDMDRALVRSMVQELAAAKRVELRSEVERSYRPLLERAWKSALDNLPKPPFEQAEAQIEREIGYIFPVIPPA